LSAPNLFRRDGEDGLQRQRASGGFARRIDAGIAAVEHWLIVLFLTAVIVLSFVQLLLRDLAIHAQAEWARAALGHLGWADACVRLLVLWLGFLGASLLTRDRKHTRIDLMSSLLPERWLPLLEMMLSAVCALICGLMVWASLAYVRTEMIYGGRLFFHLPLWVGQTILPAGFALLLFRFALRGSECLKHVLRGH
jgi:TRAP-type C4-dicarboxylate transport system permease small subunit